MTRSARPAIWPIEDRLMWQALQQSGSLLDDNGGLAHLRSTSVTVLRQAYQKWLGWLASAEVSALQIPPTQRATIERLKRWLGSLSSLRPMSRLFYVEGMLRVLRAAAPEANWREQESLVRRLRRLAGHGDRSRKNGRVLCTSVLLAAGLTYAESHPKAAPTPLERAARVRTGTMVAMLALMPLRCRTFRNLKIGETVLIENTRISVSVPGDMMKAGHPWEADVPDAVMPLLLRYITDVRPWLMARYNHKHNFLWVTNKGNPLNGAYLGIKVARATLEVTGVRVSPHLFRDAAATTLTRLSPKSARLIKPVLAHSSFETAERHYIHAGNIDAGRTYAALIRERRKNL